MSEDKKIVWRLKDLPEAGEVAELVNAGVLSKEEAREILLKEQDKEDQSEQVESLKEQIRFQQETIDKLISKLSNNYGVWNLTHTYTPHYPTRYWMSAGSTTLTSSSAINNLSIKENVVSYNLGSLSGTSGSNTINAKNEVN